MHYEGQIHFARDDFEGGIRILWGPWAWWAKYRTTGSLRNDCAKIQSLLLFESSQYNEENQEKAIELREQAEGIRAWCDRFYDGREQLPNKLVRFYSDEVGPKGYLKGKGQPKSPERPAWLGDSIDPDAEIPKRPVLNWDDEEPTPKSPSIIAANVDPDAELFN